MSSYPNKKNVLTFIHSKSQSFSAHNFFYFLKGLLSFTLRREGGGKCQKRTLVMFSQNKQMNK